MILFRAFTNEIEKLAFGPMLGAPKPPKIGVPKPSKMPMPKPAMPATCGGGQCSKPLLDTNNLSSSQQSEYAAQLKMMGGG
jgi:hypothetical protein